MSLGPVTFICKTKNCELNCKLGALTNLNKHLYKHEQSRNWYKKYKDHIGFDIKSELTEGQLNLTKLFASTYQVLVRVRVFRVLIFSGSNRRVRSDTNV
jgi:hypothetical protein